jgi:hypothetical protein
MIQFSLPCGVRPWTVLVVSLSLLVFGLGVVRAQTYKDLHDFGGTVTNAGGSSGPDGKFAAGATLDGAGDEFGTAQQGGANNAGMVWEITSGGVYKDLHDFGGTVTNANNTTGPDGKRPLAGVSFDKNGNMYGTTKNGGPNSNSGMVWEITSGGVYKDLHDFGGTVTNANNTTGPDGSLPEADVWVDNSLNIFGTALQGGPNTPASAAGGGGMVWEITSGGVYKDLHDFGGTVKNAGGSNGPDGIAPLCGVTFDGSGNMFGTTFDGGPNTANGDGMIWEITSGGVYKDLHDFGGTVKNADGTNGLDGVNPVGDVTFDKNGNLFGTTTIGGPAGGNGAGMVWEITSGGTYKDLHDFGGTVMNANNTTGPDGAIPFCNVAIDSAGNLYGTTESGGPNNLAGGGDGLLWEITSGGTYTDLHDFGGTFSSGGSSVADGAIPETGVAIDSNGDIFGTTADGGPATGSGKIGLVWEITGQASINIGLPSGLQMFSLPYTYAGGNLATLLGYSNPMLAVWSPSTALYAITPTAPANQISLGQGYWVIFPQAVTITQSGTAASTSQNFDITLNAGWNMIGDPFLVSVPVANLLFNNGTETFAQATSGNTPLIGSTVWAYPGGASGYTQATTLVPEQGDWIFASSNTDVQVPHP